MQKKYKKFSDLANDFIGPDSYTHKQSKHGFGECNAWQHGVLEFAKFLDTLGVKVADEDLSKESGVFRPFKPRKYIKCGKKKG